LVLSVEDREFEDPDRIVTAHKRILDAIRSGDGELAVAQVRFHLDLNGGRLRQILAERG
jgi:DNA-binding GntR family transcriptional regulator